VKAVVTGAILLVLCLAGGCASAPTAYVEPAPLATSDRTARNQEIFDTVARLVAAKYFDPELRGVDWAAQCARYRPEAVAAANDAELYHVLNRLCAELKESHLAALPPRVTHEIRTAHRLAIGMDCMRVDGKMVVTELVPDSPAAEAGVAVGWEVVSCDGRNLDGGFPAAQPGQWITYGFLDLANQPRAITFKPQLIPITRFVAEELADGILYLRFDRFDRESLRWLSRQLKDHRRAAGVVLDLRENPGGYVFAANLAIGEFFDHRVVTGEFVRRNGRVTTAHGWPFFSAQYTGPLAILTGGGTGSAAEIFAHVMQQHGRAVIVGRRTAGAVIVSRTYPLPGGGRLQVPVEDYRGVDGRRLEGRGVTPDITVPRLAVADLREGRDHDVDVALSKLSATSLGQLTPPAGGRQNTRSSSAEESALPGGSGAKPVKS
jgi:carboxyl-terminal processing protease